MFLALLLAVSVTGAHVEWLDSERRRLLRGCRRTTENGTVLFTPDGSGHYGALRKLRAEGRLEVR